MSVGYVSLSAPCPIGARAAPLHHVMMLVVVRRVSEVGVHQSLRSVETPGARVKFPSRYNAAP